MAKRRKTPGQRKLPGGATLYNERVKVSGSFDDKSLEYVTKMECNKCGMTKELREELPNRTKRNAFQAEAKRHDCEANTRSMQFINAAREYELGRRDLNG